MRAVVQRVISSSVSVSGEIVGSIGKGMNILLGIGQQDSLADAEYMANKIGALRIFDDASGVMNLSLKDVTTDPEILVISQFTLYGDCRKGKRPSYSMAMSPEEAKSLYEHFIKLMEEQGYRVAKGVFRAEMEVSILNDGPVTLLLDSKKEF